MFISCVIAMTAGATAANINWTGATGGSWADAANWSTGAVPGSGDVATFTFVTSPVTINLNGARVVSGLSTPNTSLTNVHTLQAGGTDTTLTIGADGITHFRGGLTIGSGTAGQRVNVILSAAQTWNASRDNGTGNAQAIFVNNNVTLQGGLGAQTLTLTGTNTGSLINGVIGNDAGSTLNIVKTGGGTWSLNSANTYSGTTSVQAGMLRLGEAGGIAPSTISVSSGATLGLRLEATVGGAGFDETEITAYRNGVNFASGSFLGLDTSNGNATYAGTLGGMNLAKTGANFLTLTGTLSPTGNLAIREGGLILTSATNLTGNATVANGASIIARAGGTGLNSAQIAALNASTTFEGTSYFGIGTGNGDFSYGNVVVGSATAGVTTRFMKVEAGTLFLTGQNTYTGGTQINTGTLSVSDIKNGGLASQMGASSNVANGIILAGGRLQYTGAGSTTDRLFNLTNNSALESSGTGALVFNSTGTITTEGNSRTLNLTGYNKDDNRLNMNLVNGTAATTIVKNGSGKWILSGNNTYTGTTTIRGGTLVFDYSTGKTPLTSTSQVIVHQGTAIFQGSGAKTIGLLNLSEGENGFGITKVTGGMNLTTASLNSANNSQRMVLLDLSGTGNTLGYTALGTGITNTASGNLLMTGGARANIIVRANDGTFGFAAGVSGNIQKLAGQTSFTGGAVGSPTSLTINSNVTNYALGSGSYTTSGNLDYQTITFDSSAGAIDVNFNANNSIASSGNGRGMLFTGTNNVTFSGAGGAVNASTWFHNYLDDSAQLNIATNLGTGAFLMVGGTGFTNFTGSSLSSADFVLNGGLFRIGTAQNLAGVYRINSAVFEIGANLSNNGPADLNQTTTNFRLTGDAGFSAHGATRTVSLGASVVWGTNNFLTNTIGDDGDHTFRLSSTRSNAMVDFRSNIDLNGKARTVEVARGTVAGATDARLSGNLTGSGIGSRFVKSGAGTLELTGTNTYSGSTRVEGGRLIIGGGGLTATTDIHVKSATLSFAGAEVINNAAGITLENGIITTAGAAETLGSLTLIGDNQLDLVGLGNVIRMAQSSGNVWSSTLSIYNWNGSAAGGGADQFFIGTSSAGITTSGAGNQLSKIFFVNPEVDGVLYTGTYGANILGTGEIIAVIPEPSAVALLAGGALGFAFIRRRRQG